MQEILGQIFGYVWGIWRFRWVALAVAWVIALCGWFWVYQMPERYQASARIQIDSNTVLRPLLRGVAIQPDIGQRISLMSRTLLSRPNLEKLMRMTDLDLQINSELQKDEMIDRLRNDIRLSTSRENTSLYSVAFSHQDREVAKRVVQSLITVFIESTLGEKRDDSTDAQRFLDKQIADYEQRLIDAEGRLAKFKQENVNVLPGETGGYYRNLVGLRSELNAARLQLRETENRRNEFRRQLEGEEPVFWASTLNDIPEAAPLESRIQSLKSRMDNLLTQYTEKHPEVIQIRNLIQDLEVEKQEIIAAGLSRDTGELDYTGLKSGTFYQQTRAMLAEAEARVAELKVRVAEYENRVADLESKVHNIPEIEAQFKQLDRDYGIVQNQYNTLLGRRESARISEDVEQNTSDVSFRVIDPPFVPIKPNEPNKPMLYSAVLVVSMLAGSGMAFVISLLRPVIIDRRSLAQVTGMPVLGSVAYIFSPAEKRAKFFRTVQFATLTLGLLAAFAVVNIGHTWLWG